MIVFCDDTTCTRNYEGVCLKEQIVITVTDGVREDGTRGTINSCSSYEDKRNEGDIIRNR